VISVYFVHESLTPGNVRAAWHRSLTAPRQGDEVDLPGAGYMGADVVWTVVSAKWLNEGAVELLMSGPYGEDPERAASGEGAAK
jgi:hypothetical protein